MKKYYYVPVTATSIYHNGISLNEHLKYVDRDLYNAENEFKEFIYGRIFDSIPDLKTFDSLVDSHKRECGRFYRERLIPQSIIVVQDNKETYEKESHESLDLKDPVLLTKYSISEKDVEDLLIKDPEYGVSVFNYFLGYHDVKREEPPKKAKEPVKQKRIQLLKEKNKNL